MSLSGKPVRAKCRHCDHVFEVDPSEVERQGGYAHCPQCGVRMDIGANTLEVYGRDSEEVKEVTKGILDHQQRGQSRPADEVPTQPAVAPPPPPPPEPPTRRRPRLEWLVVAAVAVGVLVWIGLAPGYTSIGAGIVVLGLAITGAIAISAGPKTKDAGIATGLVVAALTAIGTGAFVYSLGGGHENQPQGGTTTHPPRPAAQKAPSGFPESGPTLRVSNKVTDGARLMRDDSAHPAYLSTVTRNFCKKTGCAIPGTDVSTGDAVGPAICQARGERVTNGDDSSTVDDKNPGLYSSIRWYGVRRRDGTIGYISEVWIDPSQRHGLGLRSCPSR